MVSFIRNVATAVATVIAATGSRLTARGTPATTPISTRLPGRQPQQTEQLTGGQLPSVLDAASRYAAAGDGAADVLAGSVLTAGRIFQEAVRRRLTRRCSAPVLVAAPGEVGAAWLAARTLPTVDDNAAAALHDVLRVATLTPAPAP